MLVTGSRDWEDREAVFRAIAAVRQEVGERPITVVHGDCPTGADAMAAYLCLRQGPGFNLTEEAHPANWQLEGKQAGPIRNARMVNLGADICLAFIRNGSRGASQTARLAEQAGIPVRRWTA
ncbi:SLOG family protein [Streptomyces sp. NPDC086669]|uniref:SLOG family protein n=1 Tax=Streptomyces sp. NPDC086669 TaxID=3365753 RepID=UPI00382B974A